MSTKSLLRLNVVLLNPQIHWNTGNTGRTCLGYNATLHLVGPMGFKLDDKQLLRAGLDYWQHVDKKIHRDWVQFKKVLPTLGKAYYITGSGKQTLTDVEFDFGKPIKNEESGNIEKRIAIVLGSEKYGMHDIEDDIVNEPQVLIPMLSDKIRSYNLSTSAAMVMWEVYRQFNKQNS